MFLLRIKSSKFLLQTAFVPSVDLMSFARIWVNVRIDEINLFICKNKKKCLGLLKFIKL